MSAASIIPHFMNMIWSILRPKWSFIDIGWLDEETIRACCANAHKRSEAVVEAEGDYIEDKYVGFS